MLVRLSPEQLAARPDYVIMLQGLQVGEGGMATTTEEKTSKITIKNRLMTAAAAARVTIKFHRSAPTSVIFRVTDRDSAPAAAPKRRGPKPKSAA